MQRELITEGSRSVLYRATTDQGPVVWKLLRDASPTSATLARFNNELHITRELSVPGIRRALRKVEVDGRHGLELEYLPGAPPRRDGVHTREMLTERVQQLAGLCDTLAALHAEGVVHRDLKPANLIVHPETGVLTLIDFGSASEVQHAREAGATLEGTVAYIAPEQTGRMNRTVDNRSDLYSLGATAFELLAGQLPFLGADAAELIHSHIARPAPRLDQVNPAIPVRVADIVERLLRKDPDARYQSAAGVAHDLRLCLAAGFERMDFVLGEADGDSTFRISERLYGRAAAVEELLASFEVASLGQPTLVTVQGPSGVGKSKLVHEVEPRIVEKHGVFVEGKCRQLQRSTPYAGLASALEQLANHFLLQSEAELERIRGQLSEAVGELGGVLTSLVPAFGPILGPQPDVPPLEPNETRERFLFVLTRFFDAVATTEHPLVLFLDDLQWVDFSTLELLRHLVSGDGGRALLVVGTFRDAEVDAAHPLSRALARLESSDIHLEALRVEDLVPMLADSLQLLPAEVEDLAKLVHARTQGNPFFVRAFLSALHQEGAIHWDGHWRIDPALAQRADVTDNLATLLTSRFHALPGDTQRLLHLAACVGYRVSLDLLAELDGRSASEAARTLWPAVRAGYLLPTNRLLGAVGDELGPDDAFRFSHDRLRAAAYELVDEDGREQSHHRIAQVLQERGGEVYAIASHLNRAGARADDTGLLIRTNLQAARQAADAAAYAEALVMLEVALGVLGDRWDDEARALHELAAQAHYQLGRPAEAVELAEMVLARTTEPLERCVAQRVRLLCALATDDMNGGVQVALETLAELGEPFPANPFGLHIGLALARTKWLLWGRDPASLAEAPAMQDRRKLEAMVVLEKAVPAAFRSSSPHFPLFVLRLVQLTLEHGNGPVSAFAYAGYAIMLAGVMGDIEGSYAFGQLALTLSERMAHEHGAMRSKALFVWSNMVRHWKEPLHRSIPTLEEAVRYGAESGAQFDQVWAAFYRIVWMMVTGVELDEVAEELETYHSVFARDELAIMHTAMLRQVVHNLTAHDVEDRCVLAGPYIHDAAIREVVETTADRTQVVVYRFIAGWLCNHVGGHEQALEHLEAAEAELEAVVALPLVPLVQLEVNLARCRLGVDRPKVRKAIGALRKAARFGSSNYAHKADWLEAELALSEGRNGAAQQAVQRALKHVRGSGWRQEEARIYDTATRVYLAGESVVLAEAMADRANVSRRAWGALGLVERGELTEPESSFGASTQTSFTSSGNSLVDLTSLMKAAAAITGTLELETLLLELLTVLAENTAATHGAVILPDEGTWRVAAELDLEGGARPTHQALDAASLCAPAVLFAARSGRALLVDDARTDSRFRRYADATGTRSMLVVPTTQGGVTHGVVYFEHRTLAEAFTPERVRFAELLASQAASAMQNARLHERLAQALENEVSLNRAHRRFVPQRFLENLGHDRLDRIALGDSVEKEMSILFSDVRRFTTLIEGMSAEESIQFINGYLQHMEPAIHAQGGFVDSYIGDAIMALFEGETDSVVQAAIDMLRGLRRFNALRVAAGREPVEMGIGIAHGPVMMGTIGGPNRLKCGVIGDSVNLGARMESLTKHYGVELLITGSVKEALRQPERFDLRRVDRVTVKGKTAPVDVWEVFDADPEPLREVKQATGMVHEEAMLAYLGGDLQGASLRFSALAVDLPDDEVTHLMLARVGLFEDQGGLPEGWDGAQVMTKK